MYELNLNLLLSFFWLSLSAGILLQGIWLLIDCKINHSMINLIFQRFYFYNPTNLSKSYFQYFYIIALLINLILFILHLSSFLLFFPFFLHIFHRLYECIYVYKSKSNLKMNFFYYIFHFIYYPCVGLTIISDYKYSYTNITIMKYIFSLFVFLNASYIQYNIHLTLEKQNSVEQNEIKPIPYGYWIFNYFSCPNSIIEIIIYLSFFLTSHRTSAMASLLVWVFTNQSLSALLNHRWFCRYYKDSYPTKRRALIPFIL